MGRLIEVLRVMNKSKITIQTRRIVLLRSPRGRFV
jgi:hypothetical protein